MKAMSGPDVAVFIDVAAVVALALLLWVLLRDRRR
jgi:hypothetical protein